MHAKQCSMPDFPRTPSEKALGRLFDRLLNECSSEKLWEDRNGFIFPGRELASHLYIFPGMLIRNTTQNSWKHQGQNNFMFFWFCMHCESSASTSDVMMQVAGTAPTYKYRSFLKAIGMRPSSWQQRRRFNVSIQQFSGITLPPKNMACYEGRCIYMDDARHSLETKIGKGGLSRRANPGTWWNHALQTISIEQ